MEMKLEEAQICRLCGECESIYIDVFGEEGTKRFLGIKIHTKINIVIDETDPLPKAICVQCLGKLEFVCDFQEECLRTQQVLRERYNLPPLTDVINEADGLPHKVCVRCLGALEFLCDFHDQCHKTQERLIEAKQKLMLKCSKTRASSSPDLSNDADSDKENCAPIIKQSVAKRKRQGTPSEITKIEKSYKDIQESERSQGDMKMAQYDQAKKTKHGIVENMDVSSTAESVTSDKIILPPTSVIVEKQTSASNPGVHEEEPTERRTRSQTSCNINNSTPKIQDERKFELHSRNNKTISSIVKIEKNEHYDEKSTTLGTERIDKSNKIVWIPKDTPVFTLAEKNMGMEGSNECPEEKKKTEKLAKETPSSLGQKIKEDYCEEGEGNELRKKFGKITDLISNEQKKAIEKYYSVDMSNVDERLVGETIRVLDKKKFGCALCDATYTRQDKCQVHIWGHLDMKPFRCNACDFATVTVSNIRCHVRKSHLKIKPYACELCEKRYVTAFLLEEHMNTHTGSRPYTCNICNFTSASRQVLSYHNTTHKPTKDITCHECGKEFYSKGRLRAHMIVHDKDKKAHMCKLCSIYLCSSEALQRHNANVHSKDYVCNICGKRCQSKKSLNNHQNVHSAAKYKCTLCSNVYKSSHILKEHLLKHEGIRKYKCNICGKDFAQQSHLAAHMAVHSDKRFFCPGCKRPFNRHDNMKMHAKRCEAFLANPELKSILQVRRSRSKPATNEGKSVEESKEPIENVVLPELEHIKTDFSTNNRPIVNNRFEIFANSNEATGADNGQVVVEKMIVLECM